MTTLEPFLLAPVLVERPWGGSRLSAYGKDLPAGVRIGESWEVADLPADVAPHLPETASRIATGDHAGSTLAELIDRHGRALMGDASPTSDGRFPLLVKLLDAAEPLSIQVHPDASYVATHPEARLKTESWYLIDADDDTDIYLDVRPGVTIDDLEAAFGTREMVDLLATKAAIAGAFHHVPAGLIHALGAGCLVAEVQTPSDTTYRMYDWSSEFGRDRRPLHREESLRSARLHPSDAFSLESSTVSRSLIAADHYSMVEHRVGGSVIVSDDGGPVVAMVTEGRGRLGSLDLDRGSTVVIPASATDREVVVEREAVILEIALPV